MKDCSVISQAKVNFSKINFYCLLKICWKVCQNTEIFTIFPVLNMENLEKFLLTVWLNKRFSCKKTVLTKNRVKMTEYDTTRILNEEKRLPKAQYCFGNFEENWKKRAEKNSFRFLIKSINLLQTCLKKLLKPSLKVSQLQDFTFEKQLILISIIGQQAHRKELLYLDV